MIGVQEQELRDVAMTVVERATVMKINNQETCDAASLLLLEEIMPLRKRWLAYWEPLREAAFGSYKAILGKIKQGDEPLAEAERLVKLELANWHTKQEGIRKERQREAQEKAEAEEREARLNAAVAAEQSGAALEDVMEIIDAPATAIAPTVAPTYNRAAGISTRETWECVVTDIKRLCLAVAKGQASVEYVLPNYTALNARARADKKTMNIPGCVARNKPVVSGRVK
jgi:hypothetical protein